MQRLSGFQNGLIAVYARILAAANNGRAQRGFSCKERIEFRIGINLGDVIVEERRHFWRRRKCRGAAGSAGRARWDLRFAAQCATRSGTGSLTPSRIWASRASRTSRGRCGSMRCAPKAWPAAVASVPPTISSSPPVAAPRLSIVVLPFTNLSDDREQQYFADGITEDLTTDLVADRGHVRDLAQYRVHL